MDDVLLTSDDVEELQALKQFLGPEFSTKELGNFHFLLDLEFIRKSYGLILSQRKFILDLLREFDFFASITFFCITGFFYQIKG